MKTVRFGVIGCGWMGREFAGATARWCLLTEARAKPEIVAVCNRSPERMNWFRDRFPSVEQVTGDYRELLANPHVEAVYIAVPHHLHQEMYIAAIEAGKHLMGEKPFGMDASANRHILNCAARHPEVFVRCASQWYFYPPAQRIGALLERDVFGRILEVNSGFLHSSDLDPDKPLNWKRTTEFNGEYGCLGDLGMHSCALPFRSGWTPLNVRAILSNVMTERPDGAGGRLPCPTWDNATLLCETQDPRNGLTFPWTLRTQRIAPGEKNTWYLEILGTRASARFSTRNPKTLEFLDYQGGDQVWGQLQVGYETPFPTITGAIAEFGFGDAMLQMWAAFIQELTPGPGPGRFAGCVTASETALSHRLFTAALHSQKNQSVEPV